MVTTNSIIASWSNATGVVEYYEVTCSDNGTASPDRVNPTDDRIASCTSLPIPGDNYTMSVTTVSNGQISATDTITITALPSAVTLLEGPSNNTAISATWNIPGSIVDTFDITCSNGTASPSSITVDTSPTTDIFKAYCTGLGTPGLEYDLTVVAISNNKQSASRTVGVHASPASVALVPGISTTTMVSATWNRPESAVEHYVIECSLGDASPSTIEDTSEPSYLALCVNLTTPAATYIMTVYSIVDNGMTNTSSYIELTTLPEAVTLTEERDMVTTDSITASWVNVTGVVEYYGVICSNGLALSDQVNPTDDLMATCTDLQTPGDNYTISVSTFSNGQSSATDTITITALPSQVTELMESGATTDSVSATWTKPSGVVDSYNVTCPDNTITEEPESGGDGSTRAVTCDGLQTAGANYTITVIAISGSKASDPAMATITAVPSQVTDLMESGATTDSVSAIWTKPSGVVNSYNVICPDNTIKTVTEDNDNSTRTVTCGNLLDPGADYTITVIAISGSKASDPAMVTITALPSAVTNLTESGATNDSVSATWTKPSGVVDSYNVTCPDNTIKTVTEDNNDSARTVTCDGLQTAGADYNITVIAISGNKASDPATVTITAIPEAVELTEASDDVSFVTTSRISANWTMPNGIVEYYDVSCPNGDPSPDRVNPTDDLIASCENLPTPGDDYDISVTAVSNAQRSVISTITITALPEAVDLIKGASNTTVISATWTVPSSVVDAFNITCSEGTASPSSISVGGSPAGQMLMAYCIELPRSGEKYQLSVVAISNNKPSAPSTVDVFALPLGVDLEEGPSTTNSVSAMATHSRPPLKIPTRNRFRHLVWICRDRARPIA